MPTACSAAAGRRGRTRTCRLSATAAETDTEHRDVLYHLRAPQLETENGTYCHCAQHAQPGRSMYGALSVRLSVAACSPGADGGPVCNHMGPNFDS